MKCRYCQHSITPEELAQTNAYWGGMPDVCHKACKVEGVKREAFDCQMIDADCNDCLHFQRGYDVQRWLSCMEDKKPSFRLVNMGINVGLCRRFVKVTEAYPNKWTGRECFEHRRKA